MSDSKPSGLDRFFELRTIVAILFGVYGVVCTVWGIGFTGADEIRRAGGFNMNLVMGIVMLVTAALFALWVVVRPVEQAEPSEQAVQESTPSR